MLEQFTPTPLSQALALDASNLSESHPVVRQFVDCDEGRPPKVLSIDEEAKSVTVECPVAGVRFTVPFGWFVIEKEFEVVVFDGLKGMLINLQQRPARGLPPAMQADQMKRKYEQTRPEVEALRLQINGHECLSLGNQTIMGKLCEQVLFFLPHPKADGSALWIRVTSPFRKLPFALDTTDVLIRSLSE